MRKALAEPFTAELPHGFRRAQNGPAERMLRAKSRA